MSYYLPESVLEQILIRLPPKTLVRLRSVCKTWHSLFISNSFISSNLQCSISNSTINPILLIRQSTQWSLLNTASFSSRFIAKIPKQRRSFSFSFDIIQSLNGLVCLSLSVNFPALNPSVILWNPSIRRYLKLQPPIARHANAMGFGFDSENHDYKVIRIFHIGYVELYSLNKGAWECFDFTYLRELRVRYYSRTQCFVNGNVHWIVATRYLNNTNTNAILIFNVGEDKFNKIDLPPELVNVKIDDLRVTVIEGCLSVIHCYSKDECDVWVMREYNVAESWTKISTLDLQGEGYVFGLGTSAKVLMIRSRFWCSLIDTKSEEITDLWTRGNAITACEYTGSLVLLDSQSNGIPCYLNMRQAKERKRKHYYTFPQLSS